jgi:PHD/YefM family antitoxin component YafN of YafNO toxin-antitoxin module
MDTARPTVTVVNTPGTVPTAVLTAVAASHGRERVIVEVNGEPRAAVIALEDLDRLQAFEAAFEDRLDAEEADAILDAEGDAPGVAWTDLKRRLGL